MYKKRVFIFLIPLSVGILIFFLLIFYFNNTIAGQILKDGIKIETGDLRLTDSYQEASGTNRVSWLVADSGNVSLFLGHANPQDPGKFIDDKLFLLKDLYEPVRSPYPEVITNTIDCPSEFKPVRQDFGSGVVYKLFAGERFGYGICTKDLIKYNSFYGLFDCGKKGVFEIKLFSSAGSDNIEKIIKSFSCNN